jgi:hypothetical protein
LTPGKSRYDEARAVHDNDQYELESDRFQQQQLPNWDDDDDDLINHNLPDSTSAPQVSLLFLNQSKMFKEILVGRATE